ncbi:MAG TPA: hypothetical protein VL614_14945 [Acetobacteraceae bacterium]|nr:hypothetical protein [Acetobacteraceae bacterium]
MTIIVAHNGTMVADSAAVASGRIFPCGSPKIKRTRNGGLVACCGSEDDCFVFAEWAVAGFPEDAKPTLTAGPDGFMALHMRPDGSVWNFYSVHRSAPTQQPAYIGETTACSVVCGAMAAGASAEEAVAIAIKHTVWIGGPIQVERLSANELAAQSQ